jgi:hypothetical protein
LRVTDAWKSEHLCEEGSEFTRTYDLVWCVTQGYCGSVLLWRDSCWCRVTQNAGGIHCAHHSSAACWWGNLRPTRRGTPTFASWCQGLSRRQLPRPLDRPKRKSWAPHKFAYGTQLVSWHEGVSVQYRINNAPRPKTWNSTVKIIRKVLWICTLMPSLKRYSYSNFNFHGQNFSTS